MKVLFLTNIPSPYRADFFNEFGKLCDLTVTYEGLTSTERDNKWVGEKVEHYKPIFLKGRRVKTDQFLCFGIIGVIKWGWDAIIIGNYSSPTSMLAISYMNIHKIPYIIQADGGLIAENENKLKLMVKKRYISSASLWMSSGEATTKYLVHYGAQREKCFIYPFTSLWETDLARAKELKKQSVRKLREKLELKEDRIILSVGRFSYDAGYGKGYDILLKAAETLPDNMGVYILGDEPTEEFKEWKKEKGLNHVHFIGFKVKQELMEYYAAADLFVLMTRSDVWGLVINEAMSFGLPIITTDKCVAGLELVTNNENGYIVPVDQPNELLNKILYITSRQEILHDFGARSLKRIQTYTIENMSRVNYKILEDNIRER